MPTKPDENIDALTIEELRDKYRQIKRSQSGADSAYMREKARADELEAKIANGHSFRELNERLDQVVKKLEERDRSRELQFYVKSKALDLGLDYQLVSDIPFADQVHADAKLAALASFAENVRQAEVNRGLLATEKPRAGAMGAAPKSPLDDIVAREISRIPRGPSGF